MMITDIVQKFEMLNKIIVVSGHYGSGKTNFSINLAVSLRKAGHAVLLTDMDIVNPYFRSSEYTKQMRDMGINVVTPVYANSNLDAPIIPGNVYGAFSFEGYSIIDMGGDDAGATAIAQFNQHIKDKAYDMLYVINSGRAMVSDAQDAANILLEIEHASRLKATYLVNNSHLQQFTDADTILNSVSYAKSVSKTTNLEVLCTTASKSILQEQNNLKKEQKRSLENMIDNLYPIDMYVKKPWEGI